MPCPRNIRNDYTMCFAADAWGRSFYEDLALTYVQGSPAACTPPIVVQRSLAVAYAAPALKVLWGRGLDYQCIRLDIVGGVFYDYLGGAN